ncbi:MAG: hypothetical protein GY847_17420 [Proteobacteria bacterium]|nr:hypothetical protein [Pseudomonadota bacterium]
MKRLVFPLAIFFVQVGIFLSSATAGDNWELVKQKDNIKVYTRPFPGSEVDEFKGTAIIHSRTENILALFMGAANQTGWMDRCIEARMVKKVSEFEGVIYNVTDLPWPASDRDVVVMQRFRIESTGKIVINFRSVKNDSSYVPYREDTVRMTDLEGKWVLISLDRNRTKATYRIRANPAGMIPPWLANYASRNIPYHTLKAVMDMAQKPEYIERGKKLREKYGELARKVVRGRLISSTKEIGDEKLVKLLLEDIRLIELILDAEGEIKPIIDKWVKTNYYKEEGNWFLRGAESKQ